MLLLVCPPVRAFRTQSTQCLRTFERYVKPFVIALRNFLTC